MSNKYDFPALARELLSKIDSLLLSWLPDGHRKGKEWVSINPTRSDSSAGSFSVNLLYGRWSDFATGDSGGDLISLYQYLKGVDAKQAYADLSSSNVVDFNSRKNAKNKDNKKPEGKIVKDLVEPLPVPDDAGYPSLPKGRKPDAIFKDPETGDELYPETKYRNFEGKLVYRVITYRLPDGRKNPIPSSWCRYVREQKILDKSIDKWVGTGKILDTTGWHNKDWPNNRPLCGMDYVFKRPESTVLVVEGEKKWAYVIQNLPEYAAVCWRGGASAHDLSDWSQLTGRDLIFIPDYDEGGQKAMLKMAHKLQRTNNSVRICWESLSAGLHEKAWDIADIPNPDDARTWIKENAVTLRSLESLIMDEKMKSGADEYNAQDELLSSAAGETLKDQQDLRCLGYGKDNKVYFITKKRGIVVSLSPNQLADINYLMSLMPLNFWYDLFAKKVGGLDKHKCSDTLQRWAESKGYFNPDIIRGAGVWVENDGKYIFHMGQKLMVNEDIYHVNEYQSEYMYEATRDLGVKYVKHLATKDSKKLVEVCEWLDWDAKIYGKLLAGFAVIAPLCGGLEWRPHIWVTGSSGAGKTTVMSKILLKACGKVGIFVIGDSTAAGCRQKLGSDALPVIWDEFEGNNLRRQEENQRVLELARGSSSDTDFKTYRGTVTGEGDDFCIRSCFAFASIGVNIRDYADESRLTILTLKQPPDKKTLTADERGVREKKFLDYEAGIDDLLTPEYVNALHMRSFKLLPIIRKNARIFKSAVIKHLGSSRLGDQLGALCAGAYSLEHSTAVTKEEAENWITAQDWSLSTPVEAVKDHDKCLAFMMQYILRIQADNHYIERGVNELIEMVLYDKAGAGEADNHLKRYGLKVDKDSNKLYVANSHIKLAEIMAKGSYQSWHRLLLQCAGAEDAPTTRFGFNITSRAVAIPLNVAIAGAEQTKRAF